MSYWRKATGSDWVPLAIMKPPPDTWVLVSRKDRTVDTARFARSLVPDATYVAWMPLPPPYEPPAPRDFWLAVGLDGSVIAFDDHAAAQAYPYKELIHVREVQP